MKNLASPVLLLSVAVILASNGLEPALARPEYRSRIPNGFNVPDVPAVGHTDPEGSTDSLNSFGKAFGGVGKKWTTMLCQADSDGDGQTNGQELGDPCCVWSASSSGPQRTSGLSDPGKSSSTADASQWSDLNCTATVAEAEAGTTTSSSPHRWSTASTVLVMLLGLALGAIVAARG